MPRRKRLLVIEDNAAEQLSITALLEHDDIEIATAGTGAEGLDLLNEQRFDCVVLDSGFPTCPALKSWRPCAATAR